MFKFFKNKIREKEKVNQQILMQLRKQEKIEEAEKAAEVKEYNQVNNDLSKELSENFWPINIIFTNICARYNLSYKCLKDKSYPIKDNLIYSIFFDIYRTAKNTSSLKEFDYLCNGERLREIIVEEFDPFENIKNLYKYEKNFNDWIIKDEHNDKKILQSYFSNDLFNEFEILIRSFKEDESKYGIELCNIVLDRFLIMDMVSCVKALNRVLVISRSKNKLIENEELYKIEKNLKNQFKDNYEQIISKIYPIYRRFYSDLFEESMDVIDFSILINIMETTYIDNNMFDDFLNYLDKIFNPLKNEIKNLIIKVKNDVKNEDVSFDIIINDFYDFIKSTNWNNFDDKSFNILYPFIIYKLRNVLPTKLLVESYTRSKGIYKLYDDYIYEQKLLKEKERFINNDFTIENMKEKDKFSMENINSGIEFENYLKLMFEKLGYAVETTKITGDQGADLIILKDSMKTVVQAKYYSGSVGNKAVQEITGAINFYSANKGMVVTNSYFTNSAIELANANDIKLIDGNELSNIRESILQDIK